MIGIVEPLPSDRNTNVEFRDETVGTNIPKHFVSSVEKGFRSASKKGTYAGFPIVGVRYRLQDGDNHAIDSSDWSFQLAGEGSMKQVG